MEQMQRGHCCESGVTRRALVMCELDKSWVTFDFRTLSKILLSGPRDPCTQDGAG